MSFPYAPKVLGLAIDPITGGIDAQMEDGTTIPLGPPNTISRLGYYRVASPASGSTIAIPQGMAVLTITGSGILASLTIQLPSSPQDKQAVRISSSMAITVLNIADAVGNAVETRALSSLQAGVLYQYQQTTTTSGVYVWTRLS